MTCAVAYLQARRHLRRREAALDGDSTLHLWRQIRRELQRQLIETQTGDVYSCLYALPIGQKCTTDTHL